jgi:hypothetical protein
MKDACWLVVSNKGVQRIVKGQTRAWQRQRLDIPRPRLAQGEYAVLISVEVPDSAFRPIGLPTAHIKVPESALVGPPVEVQVEDPPRADDGIPWEGEGEPLTHPSHLP